MVYLMAFWYYMVYSRAFWCYVVYLRAFWSFFPGEEEQGVQDALSDTRTTSLGCVLPRARRRKRPLSPASDRSRARPHLPRGASPSR